MSYVMKYGTLVTFLLALVSRTLALDLSRFLWIGSQPSNIPEKTQVVEMVKWRQPVCVMPGKGVLPCLAGLRKFQSDYERLSGKGLKEELAEKSKLHDHEPSKASRRKEDSRSSKDLSPEEIGMRFLENIEASRFELENELEAPPASRFLKRTPRLDERQKRSPIESDWTDRPVGRKAAASVPQQIYVTKVLDSPVTATLVAYNCLPDIGVPLCEDYRGNAFPEASGPGIDPKPSLSVSVEVEKPSDGGRGPGNFGEGTESPFFGGNGGQSSGSRPVIDVIHQSFQKPRPEVIISKPDAIQSSSSALEGPGATITISKPVIIDTVENARPLTNQQSQYNFDPVGFNVQSGPSLKPELSIQVSKEGGNVSPGNPVEPSKHTIVQTIHDIVNDPQMYPTKNTIQTFLQGPAESDNNEKGETKPGTTVQSSPKPGILSNFFRPVGIFDKKQTTTSTTPEPQISIELLLEPSHRDFHEEEFTGPVVDVHEVPTSSEVLRKPADHVSGRHRVLDLSQEHQEHQTQAETKETSSLFDDLFVSPIRPIDNRENRLYASKHSKKDRVGRKHAREPSPLSKAMYQVEKETILTSVRPSKAVKTKFVKEQYKF